MMTGIRYDWGVWNENNYFYLFLFFYVPSRYRILHPHYGNNELVILCDLDLGVVNLFCLHALARFHFNVIICGLFSRNFISSFISPVLAANPQTSRSQIPATTIF